jgi:Asp-tRNA(Asn)/Glu-tRNA(Gln) amidotransferase A subunit family amidase
LRRDVMTGMPVEDECVAAVDAAAKALASAGYDVEERHPPSLEGSLLRTAPAIARVGLAARLEQVRWLERIVGRNVTWEEIDQTEPEGAVEPNKEDVAAAAAAIRAEFDALDPWFRDACDVLVTPVARQPAWPLGSDGGARLAGVFPAPFSFGGQPAMSVPLHWTAGGLPVGVQLIAARGRDEFLLGVGADLEAAMPWAGRCPAVADLTP